MYQHCGNRKKGSAFKQFSGVKINFAKMKFFYHPEGISSIARDIPIQQYIYKALCMCGHLININIIILKMMKEYLNNMLTFRNEKHKKAISELLSD